MPVIGRIIDEVRCIQCIGYRMKCQHFYSPCFNTICGASGKAPGCKTPRFNNPQIFPFFTDTPVSAGSGPTFNAHRDAGSGFFGNKKMPVRMSNTSTETTCLKLIFFTKFECSMKKGAGTPYRRARVQKALDVGRPSKQNKSFCCCFRAAGLNPDLKVLTTLRRLDLAHKFRRVGI